MPWLLLLLAGLLEVGWAIGIKASDGFTKPVPTALAIPAYIASLIFLAWAMRDIPLGTAYAVWTGIGIIGAAIAGVVYWSEPASLPRIGCILLIIAGIVGLRLLTPAVSPTVG